MCAVRNLTLYKNKEHVITQDFIYHGTAALKRGYGMCFNKAYATTTTGQTAADPFGARGLKEVATPSPTNNMDFAGVLMTNYPADADGKIKIVKLAVPGGCAMVAGIESTVVNETELTFTVPTAAQVVAEYFAQAGIFGKAGLPGRGTVRALQTQADADGSPRETAYIGDAAYANATGTITASGKFTNVVAGDVVWILAGGVANVALAGKYYAIGTPTANACIISLTPGGDAFLGAAANGAKIAIATVPGGEPLTLAYLYDGTESGGCEWDVAVTSGTSAPMVGGTTNLTAGVTIAVSDVAPLLDGKRIGMLKKFWLGGTTTTGSYVITPASLGLQPDGTILATVSLKASLGMATLEWTGQKWDCKTVNTAAESA
jgi:hypothetical protein